MKNALGLFISVVFIGTVILTAKLFEKIGKEASRKFIHIMLSNWWIIAMIFFDNMWWASVLPAAFVVINYISLKKDVIKVMERTDEDENKDSFGTVYYAISLLILSLITFSPIVNNPLIGLCGILVMGYGDGLAAVIGKAVKSKQFKIGSSTKSIVGCLTMFLITLVVMAAYFGYMRTDYWILKSIVVAGLMTMVECVSVKGTDNITVPLVTSLLAFLMT